MEMPFSGPAPLLQGLERRVYTAGEAKVQLDPFMNVTPEQVPPLLLASRGVLCAHEMCAQPTFGCSLQPAPAGSFSLGVGSLPDLICSCLLWLGAARTSHQAGRRIRAFSS